MVFVDVKFRPFSGSHEFRPADIVFSLLTRSLGDIIAEGLNIPGDINACLTSDDIQIGFRLAGEYDIAKKSIEIVVWADDYPKRSVDLQSVRVPSMGQKIRSLLDRAEMKHYTVSLYVRLEVSGHAEF